MATEPQRRSLQFVVKITKYCNLRCSYCYEYRELGNKTKMALGDLAAFFRHVASYAAEHDLTNVDFLWHGGEPFLVPIEYYSEIKTLQREAFRDLSDRVTNSAQTNLTILTDRHLAWLKEKRFIDSLGISFDVSGDQRVDTGGKVKTEVVLRNLQKLIDHEIEFGGIAVLARNTLPAVRRIYRFYDAIGVSIRFLPFYMDAFAAQVDAHGLTFDEIVGALNEICDEWITSPTATPVEPIQEYIGYALAAINGRRSPRYSMHTQESVFIVDTTGDTYGMARPYEAEHRYGNVFQEPFGAILNSAGRDRAVLAAERRANELCQRCPYLDYCPGFHVAAATPQQQNMLATSGCLVRPVLDHIVTRVAAAGLVSEGLATAANAVAGQPGRCSSVA
jgi:uncharacterized protein